MTLGHHQLVIKAGTVQKMLLAKEYGLLLIYSNHGLVGATTPIRPAGTLTLLNAELSPGPEPGDQRGRARRLGQPNSVV